MIRPRSWLFKYFLKLLWLVSSCYLIFYSNSALDIELFSPLSIRVKTEKQMSHIIYIYLYFIHMLPNTHVCISWIDWPLCARPCVKSFAWIISFNLRHREVTWRNLRHFSDKQTEACRVCKANINSGDWVLTQLSDLWNFWLPHCPAQCLGNRGTGTAICPSVRIACTSMPKAVFISDSRWPFSLYLNNSCNWNFIASQASPSHCWLALVTGSFYSSSYWKVVSLWFRVIGPSSAFWGMLNTGLSSSWRQPFKFCASWRLLSSVPRAASWALTLTVTFLTSGFNGLFLISCDNSIGSSGKTGCSWKPSGRSRSP